MRTATIGGTVLSVEHVVPGVSLMERLARLFREPTTDGGTDVDAHERDDRSTRTTSDATSLAVVVESPPAGVRRYELTVRAETAVAAVEPDLLSLHFETFDEGSGTVRARAVDVEGTGRTIESAATLFVVRFASAVAPETVSLDGTIDGHDEEPVPWTRVRLTPAD